VNVWLRAALPAPSAFRFADLVMRKIEGRLFIVALDREHFLEHRLASGNFPLRERTSFLEKIDVRVELNLDKVWRLDAFLDGSEVDTFPNYVPT